MNLQTNDTLGFMSLTWRARALGFQFVKGDGECIGWDGVYPRTGPNVHVRKIRSCLSEA